MDVQGAGKDINAGKDAVLNACAIECLKRGGTNIIKLLVRLLNQCFVTSMVPIE